MKSIISLIPLIVAFSANLSYAAFSQFSSRLPMVNSDGTVTKLEAPRPIPGKDPFDPKNWEPFRFFFKNVDGTYQKNRTIDYPVAETKARPLGAIFYYQDSALFQGIGENFSIISLKTGSVIKALPKSPTPWSGAVAIPMDDAGKRVCMLASHYAEVLDLEKSSWVSFTDTMKTPIFQKDSNLVILPIASDGDWVTYMLAPDVDDLAMKYDYDVYKTNCFDSRQTMKIGSVSELKVEPDSTGSPNVHLGVTMSAVKISEDTFVISRSTTLFSNSPSVFAKIQITKEKGVEILGSTKVPNFAKIKFLAYEPSKHQLVVFGDWFKGYNIVSPNNAILDLTTMSVREGAGVNKQAGAYYPVNKTSYTLRGDDLLSIGDDPSTLDPSWTDPVTSPMYKTEIFDFSNDQFEFFH